MARGKEIRIYLAGGSVTGIRTVEVINWTGRGLLFPRNHIAELRDWDETKGSCVYFLFGHDDAEGKPLAYVGQTDDIVKRIQKHLKEKDYWNELVIFNSKDRNFNTAHVRYLEARLYEIAESTDRYRLTNKSQPRAPRLSRGEKDSMEEFLENIRLLIGTLGYKIVEPIVPSGSASSEDGGLPSVVDDPHAIIEYRFKGRGFDANGLKTDEGFVVLKGSMAKLTEAKSLKKGNQEQRKYMRYHTVETEDGYLFKSNVLFNSPSQAASVVAGAERNGWDVWKGVGGKSLRQREDEMAAFMEKTREALERLPKNLPQIIQKIQESKKSK